MGLNILSFIILFFPTIWELADDERGDNNKTSDTISRLAFTSSAGAAAHYISGENWLTAFNLSLAIHFAFFDYCIAAILIRNGTLEPPRGVKYSWFDYSGKKGVIDNISFWKNLNPYVKLLIRVSYFVIAIILYFTI